MHDAVERILQMNAQEIGQAIKACRRNQGLTQADVAAAANVGVRFMVEIEAGKPTARLDRLLAVLHALGLRLEVLS